MATVEVVSAMSALQVEEKYEEPNKPHEETKQEEVDVAAPEAVPEEPINEAVPEEPVEEAAPNETVAQAAAPEDVETEESVQDEPINLTTEKKEDEAIVKETEEAIDSTEPPKAEAEAEAEVEAQKEENEAEEVKTVEIEGEVETESINKTE